MTKDWLKEYAPRTSSDLVLQKPKLDQLNAWLQRASTWVGMVRSCSIHLLPFLKIGEGDKGSLGFGLLYTTDDF